MEERSADAAFALLPPPMPPTAAAPSASGGGGSSSAATDATTSSTSSSSTSISSAAATGAETAAAAAGSASRMRHFGRLKSFSSRQRQAQPPPAAAAAPVKSRGGRRWGHRAPHAAAEQARGAPPPPPLPLAPAAGSARRADDDDDAETKESVAQQQQQAAARLEVQQQIQQTRPLQRVQCLRLTCAAPPDLVLPYLYGDRKSRINAIMHGTACTIDYCPMSPGDEPQSPQSRAYILNFLVSGESAASLEEATRMLRALVEKVEVHLQKKMRIRSLHAMSHRAMSAERPGVQDSSEVSAAGPYVVSFAQGFATPEATRGAEQRMEHEREQYAAARPHRAISTALETPLDRYRMIHASVRHDDDFGRREYQERAARVAAMQVDSDDAVYYDRWGRPVYRHVQDAQTGEFGHGAGADVEGDAAGHSSAHTHSQAPRSAHRRRWQQYADESEWREPPREFARASTTPGDGRDSPAAVLDRRVVPPAPPLPRRYAVYRPADEFAEYEFEDDSRVRFGSRVDPRAPPPFPADERYSDFDTEDLLEREEDLLAAQEYAIAARVQSAAYAARRGGMRHPAYYRDASPPRYLEPKRASRSGSLSRYPPRYFDDHEGEWLTDEDEQGVVYRRYPRYPTMAYPRVYTSSGVRGSSSSSRQRSSSFPSPGRHSRPVPPDSPAGGGMLKRRKTSGVSYDGEYARTDHARAADAPVPMPAFAAAQVYRDDQRMNAVASIEVPLSDESSPSSSPGADRGASPSLVFERASRPDLIDTQGVAEAAYQQIGGAEGEAAAGKRDESAAEAMEVCDKAGGKSDQLQDVAIVVDAVADAVSAEDASDATDVTSHDAIGEELHSESVAGSGPSSAAASDNDHAGDVAMLTETEPEPSTLIEPKDAAVPTVLPAPAPAPATGPRRSSWRVRANESLISALRRDTMAESERLETRSAAASQRVKCLALEARSTLLAQLGELVSTVYDLQCRVVASSCPLDLAARREMLDVLDGAMQASGRPDKSTAEKLAVLREGLASALSRCDLASLAPPPSAEAAPLADEEQPEPQSRSRSPVTSTDGDPALDKHWDGGSGWFDGADNQCGAELLGRQDATAAPAAPGAVDAAPAAKRSPKRGESLALKAATDSALAPSPTSSSYASTLFLEVAACSPSSFVMKGMQKRLAGEIERANAYYYLHPVTPLATKRVRPPLTAACDFGCGSGAAPAWVQKVIAQITSRMKWFDEVTYALARARSGGPDASAERLNRKKMNSTIRKLHLMAIQLHCVVSHLYCLRGRAECSESDSLPAALNSSYFEKRMIAYKARLKLDADLHGTPDELLRDTFEFFPEFLLCLEMWGYDYREECAAGASALRGGRQALPLALFARVEAAVFDYEADRNGLLQTVCEELLTIVCLWNDFVWGDNLATLPVARIAAFEAEMKASTARILHTYALHVTGAWAARLLRDPDELRGLRFTQQNAYYAERVQLPKIAGDDDDARAVASAYWRQKREAPDPSHAPPPLSVAAIEKWSREAAAAHALPWSRVFELRCELETCGAVVAEWLRSDRSSSSEADARELLRRIAQARIVGADAAAVCERTALHFAALQLPQEPRAPEEPEPAAATAPEPTPEEPVAGGTLGKANALERQDDVTDLVQILASTRKELAEVFSARTRSGRVRDKLQAQAVHLAQQTLGLLQTIAARERPTS